MKNMKIMSLMNNHLIQEGYFKYVYTGSNNDKLILSFKDTLPFMKNSSMLWNLMNAHMFNLLHSCNIPNHFIKMSNLKEHEVYNTSPFPFHIRMTNIITQPVPSVFKLEKGTVLKKPLFEFITKEKGVIKPIELGYLKMFDWCVEHHFDQIKQIAHRVNDILRSFFFHFGADIAHVILLFGLFDPEYTFAAKDMGKIIVIDDLTPNSFALWHKNENRLLEMEESTINSLASYMKINTNSLS